ncbi:uncharacterized protein [Medicago truncatula]|uniref:uncharacterized protein n=1 Tax=Medicago truncatula TaxID=3880 RepID=UPI0019675EDB|nr:uncharacterized protein LOC120576873 [Medicago truncatula]
MYLENLEKETIKWCRGILRNSQTAIQVLKVAINAVDDGHARLQDAKPVAVEKRVRKIAPILTMKMMIQALKKRRNLWLLRKRNHLCYSSYPSNIYGRMQISSSWNECNGSEMRYKYGC